VLDEVQRAPGLFQVLRGLIDERIHHGEPAGQFLLLGSASIDLLRQSSESLAGRIAYLELSPLDVREIGSDQQTRLWIRGGIPRSFLAGNDADSAIWRENFVRTNVRKRLIKSPKTYIRDSGIVHTLLRLDDEDSVLGHPVAGMSWEGFVVETLIRAAPDRTQASFYRTATGVEIALVLELPGNRLWAVEIKRSLAPKVEKGLRVALADLGLDKAFLVYPGEERYPKGDGIEAIGLRALADALSQAS
jgi:predicted AAA+ superfamily ATPase